MTPFPRSNYTLDEVEGLVEMYEEVESIKDQLWVLVRYADLDIALRKMPPKLYQATLLVGLIGLDTRWAGKQFGVSHDTMWRRYRMGLEWLTNQLNGVR
jgi:DNA-directed RNA polymerase specialized sigma24 family protein